MTLDNLNEFLLASLYEVILDMGSTIPAFRSWPLLRRGGQVVRSCCVNFQCKGILLIWIIVGQRPIALAVGAGGECLDIFFLIYLFSFLSLSLGEGPI